ncbi:MAG: hypothetical protein NT015_07320 [Alphaproteobacteria bacterium]|nr:hypothetical protein [Alphaproteobacteria bacterium]
MIDDILHELVADADGTYALRDKVYRKEEFDGNFVLSDNSPYGAVAIERVQFIGCNIINRRISVYGTPALVDVSFVNTRFHTYTFMADNLPDNVSVIGGARSILWLHAPIDLKTNRDIEGVTLRHPNSPDGVCLDLSAYLGQAEILHADPRNIRINPNIHVVCVHERLETVDWENDPILSKTYFRVMLDKAEMSETGFYIGSIIGKSGKIIPTFDVALTELRRRGLVD